MMWDWMAMPQVVREHGSCYSRAAILPHLPHAAAAAAAVESRCGSHSGHFGRRQQIKESDLMINGVV